MVVAAANNKLKELGQSHGLAQVGLAVLAKVSPNTVLSIERWGHVPSTVVQQKIAGALGVQTQAIWPDEEPAA